MNNASRKKIVFDARESGTSTGRYIDKLLAHLHKLEPAYQIIILAKSPRVDYLKKLLPNFSVSRCDVKEFTFAEQFELLNQIKNLKADLVHFPMVQQPILYRGRAATTMNDLTTVRFRNPATNPIVFIAKQFVYKFVNRIAARKSKALITYTEYVKKDVADFTKVSLDKITAIHLAAERITDKAEAVAGLKGKQFIMYVGRPQPHKNLSRLIDAFKLLQSTHPDLKLVLAGKKDILYERHEQMVKDRDIKNVIFTGFVSEGQLRWLYENTSAYIFPSLSEGFGLPGLEAMVHNAPVVSSSATCLPEVYGDAVLYFDPLNVSDMASKIGQVLDDKALADKLRVKGAKQVAKYSWPRVANQTLEVYEKVLDEA